MLDSPMTKLPEHGEMERRLKAVSADPGLEQKFYPWLLRYAGVEMATVGLKAFFAQAIHRATIGSPIDEAVVYCNVDDCISALVQDVEVRQAVRTGIREVFPIPTFESQLV